QTTSRSPLFLTLPKSYVSVRTPRFSFTLPEPQKNDGGEGQPLRHRLLRNVTSDGTSWASLLVVRHSNRSGCGSGIARRIARAVRDSVDAPGFCTAALGAQQEFPIIGAKQRTINIRICVAVASAVYRFIGGD